MSRKQKQQTFIGKELEKINDKFGGSLLKGSNAKTKRPLDSKLPIHLVLRSAKGVLRLPKTFSKVNTAVDEISRKHGVKIYKYANVGNHLHMVLKIPARSRWSAYIRELTGHIASTIKNLQIMTNECVWLYRPFTRIVRGWQKAFKIALEYVELNQLEAEGFISRREIRNLKDLRAIFESSN